MDWLQSLFVFSLARSFFLAFFVFCCVRDSISIPLTCFFVGFLRAQGDAEEEDPYLSNPNKEFFTR